MISLPSSFFTQVRASDGLVRHFWSRNSGHRGRASSSPGMIFLTSFEKGFKRPIKTTTMRRLLKKWPKATCWAIPDERDFKKVTKNGRIRKQIKAPQHLKMRCATALLLPLMSVTILPSRAVAVVPTFAPSRIGKGIVNGNEPLLPEDDKDTDRDCRSVDKSGKYKTD